MNEKTSFSQNVPMKNWKMRKSSKEAFRPGQSSGCS